MVKKELTLKEIQTEMLKTMIKIDEICEFLHINYSLAYGSLIGAIRHDGFIPWDDDLDIFMSKKDLDIFSDYCLKHETEIFPFKLCRRDNVKNYSYNIPRFANLNFEYVNTDKYQSMFEIGVFVDIYPIEGFGNNEDEAQQIFDQCKRLNRLYYIYINPLSRKNFINTFLKKIISKMLHIIYKNNYFIHQEKKFDKILSSYSDLNCNYVGNVRWAILMVLLDRNKVFDGSGNLKVIKHKFEDVELNILENYDYVLKKIYGNYMQLPPENERYPYHEYKIFRR